MTYVVATRAVDPPQWMTYADDDDLTKNSMVMFWVLRVSGKGRFVAAKRSNSMGRI